MKGYEDGLLDGFEESAKALEIRAATIEQVERAMRKGALYYSPEVNTLRAAAAMLRSINRTPDLEKHHDRDSH